MIPLWLIKAGAVLALLAGAFVAGWLKSSQHHEAKQIKADLASERATRVLEAQAVRNMSRISDALTKERLASDRSAADLQRRLREQSEAAAAEPAIAACRSTEGATAARVLPPDIGRDLAALMGEAEVLSARLRACQGALSAASDALMR